MDIFTIALIIALFSAFYHINKLNQSVARQYRENDRFEAELTEIRLKIRELNEHKASNQKVSDLWDKCANKAEKTEIEEINRRFISIETIVFENDSLDDYIKRHQAIYKD